MSYIYLASPYSHPLTEVREERFEAACKVAAKLMQRGRKVFSPIAHSHHIDKSLDLPGSGQFWKEQDIPLLRHAEELVVLMLPGWMESVGVAWEIEYAKSLNIPITYLSEHE